MRYSQSGSNQDLPHLQLLRRGAGEPSVHRNKLQRGFSHPQSPNSSQGEEAENANSKGNVPASANG
jgi:hypothetical protein